MTSRYLQKNVTLTKAQKEKIASAFKNKCSTTVKLSPSEMDGDDVIFLTKNQIKKMETSKGRNKGINLKLSASQVKYQAKDGGFLPFLLGAT